MRVFCFAQGENKPSCTTVSYLFTYLLPDGYLGVSYPVGYQGKELPNNGSAVRKLENVGVMLCTSDRLGRPGG